MDSYMTTFIFAKRRCKFGFLVKMPVTHICRVLPSCWTNHDLHFCLQWAQEEYIPTTCLLIRLELMGRFPKILWSWSPSSLARQSAGKQHPNICILFLTHLPFFSLCPFLLHLYNTFNYCLKHSFKCSYQTRLYWILSNILSWSQLKTLSPLKGTFVLF